MYSVLQTCRKIYYINQYIASRKGGLTGKNLILIQVEVDNSQPVEAFLWKAGDLKQIIWTPLFEILGWTTHLVEREIKKLKVWQVGHLRKNVNWQMFFASEVENVLMF